MEMTQIRHEDDDMIELHNTLGSRFRDDTIMEITIQGGDDIVDVYNTSAIGCTTTLKSLIDKDPHILHKISLTTFSETPLHISALLGHLEFTKTLLTENPLLAGHVEIVQNLLTIYEDACLFHDQNGRIPLHYAAMRGRVEVVEKLIVARLDSVQVIQKLLTHTVNPFFPLMLYEWVCENMRFCSLFFEFCSFLFPLTLSLFVVDLKVKSLFVTVLHLCVKYNQLKALDLLVKSLSDDGDFLNFKTSDDGNTILHLAVMQKQIETVKYLLLVTKVKKEVDSRNNKDFTALKMLENCPKDFNSFTIRNMLLDSGARIERVNNPSESAKTTQSGKEWWKNLESWLYNGSGTVITTITFQQAASPPGGVWPQSGNVTHYIDHFAYSGYNIKVDAATSVVGSIDPLYYFYFVIFNAISFIASVIVTFLLISGFPVKNKICMGLLTIALYTTLAFLVITYMTAVSMVTPISLYDLKYKELSSTQIWVLGSLVVVISLVFVFHLIRPCMGRGHSQTQLLRVLSLSHCCF
ncbi:hypothetical protein ACB092_04G039500 [Castanea dentata]